MIIKRLPTATVTMTRNADRSLKVTIVSDEKTTYADTMIALAFATKIERQIEIEKSTK